MLKHTKTTDPELYGIVSGGTDNHIVLVDLRAKKLTGKLFQDSLEYVGITVNKNMIPFYSEKPSITSGVRIGLTSVSQRGFKEPDIAHVAEIMNKVASAPEDKINLDKCKTEAL